MKDSHESRAREARSPDEVKMASRSSSADAPSQVQGQLNLLRTIEGGKASAPSPATTATDGAPLLSTPPSQSEPDAVERSAPRKAKRKKTSAECLGAFLTFAPEHQQLARLREEAPRVAGVLNELVKEFRTDQWWRDQFEAGNYSNPARCFDNFVMRRERIAAERGGRVVPVTAGRRQSGNLVDAAGRIAMEASRG